MYRYSKDNAFVIQDHGDGSNTSYRVADDNPIYVALLEQGVEIAPYVAPTPVIMEVSPYQARKALKDAGVLASVLALMASLDETDDARMAWEYATVIRRDSPFIATLGASLGLTEAQIDALFVAAAGVQ